VESPLEPLRIDVPVEAAGVAYASVAVRCFAPEPAAAASLPDPLWVFATHGSGADWRYWDIWVEGREDEGYSFAEFFTGRGVGVVAIDVLGIADSPFPADGALLTLETLARAHHQVATEARARLAAGTLLPGLDPVEALWCGVGHSGGGGTTVVQQSTCRSFDFLAVLGMPADDFEVLGGHDGVVGAMVRDEHGLLVTSPSATPEERVRARARAHLDDVPEDVIAARPGRPLPPSWPSLMQRGTLLPYARTITCPVFLGFGEVDYGGTPFEEPGRYAQASDVTVYIQPGSAHQHNSSAARRELWTSLFNWLWGRARFRDGLRPDTSPRAQTPIPA
jgi:hypothetical protein